MPKRIDILRKEIFEAIDFAAHETKLQQAAPRVNCTFDVRSGATSIEIRTTKGETEYYRVIVVQEHPEAREEG